MLKQLLAHRKIMVLGSLIMLAAGLYLSVWSLTHLPFSPRANQQFLNLPISTAASGLPLNQPSNKPLSIRLQPEIPVSLNSSVQQLASDNPHLNIQIHRSDESKPTAFIFDFNPKHGYPIYEEFFAATTRFDTLASTIELDSIEEIWLTSAPEVGAKYQQVAILEQNEAAIEQLFDTAGPYVVRYAELDELVEAVWQNDSTLALVPFELLTPRLKVLAINGQNPVENVNRFDPFTYPLIAKVYAHASAYVADTNDQMTALLTQLTPSNRDPKQLTVVAMTGVTALVRRTAAQLDRFGADWPAQVVGPELLAADITTISNEVPFVPGCQTNDDPDNLTFCTNPAYMATLLASGADVVGLTGNHQNDYGREAALQSLALYKQAGLPIYGGGPNLETARATLYLEHNGNRIAFLGANSYGPPMAWATDDAPGSAPFDLALMSNEIRAIKQENGADVILAELQFQESYGVEPLSDQRYNFRALIDAGADIVTGIQSHVPQAIEFVNEDLILYGLGNLYFDQMWSMNTREALIVKHTIYAGKHISTQMLPTVLQDYGQPHWATEEERTQILQRLFEASRKN